MMLAKNRNQISNSLLAFTVVGWVKQVVKQGQEQKDGTMQANKFAFLMIRLPTVKLKLAMPMIVQ